MYPVAFEYLEPRTLQETVQLLKTHGQDARILAGGQSLVPLMKLRLARPKYLIDLNRVPGLSYIREDNGFIIFGTLTRHVEIEKSELVRARIPMMSEAASRIADTQVRNLGTIGGALAEADPAGDWGPVILALNARIKCLSPTGERYLIANTFFESAYETALRVDELVTEIAIPIPPTTGIGTFLKLERVTGDFAIASVAIQADIDQQGVCRDIGIGLGGIHEIPIKAVPVEEALRGHNISKIKKETEQRIQDLADPIGDVRGSPEYKKEMLKVIFQRALQKISQSRSTPN